MSKTIAIYSMKGGVGKTTLATNLAWCAAKAGHRTLLWDLDAQGGAAVWKRRAGLKPGYLSFDPGRRSFRL